MGQKCTKYAIDVIPDEEVMLDLVSCISAFEMKLKKGEQLTRAQEVEKGKVLRVVREMKRLQKFGADKESLRPRRQALDE
tara:strand:+ start:1912 stop:2151 length:240 start_codon:yes stop_codon:yes gene_type:complete